MQVTILGAQLGPGSELVDWYRDATSVPFGLLLIDLSPRTDDRLRYCTNSGSVPSKFLPSWTFKASEDFGWWTHKISLLSKCSNRFPANEKATFLPNRVCLVSMRMLSKSTQRKLASHKKTSRGKVSRRSLATIAKKNNLEAKKKRSVVRERIATNSSHYTSRH